MTINAHTLVIVLITAVQAAICIAIGWWWKGRQSDGAPADQTAAQQLLGQLGTLSTDMARDVDEHSTRVEHFGGQLTAGTSEAAVDSGESAAIAEILTANKLLQQKLASTEERLRQYAEKAQFHLAEARVDALTQLANRRAFDEALKEHQAQSRSARQPIALLMLDVDRFKQLNDKFGHPAGDYVLKRLGMTIARLCPQHAVAARYGGEEFSMVLPGSSLEDAKKLAELMRQEVAADSYVWQANKLSVAVSLGISAAIGETGSDGLLGNADAALYAAKKNGRNRCYFHDGTQCWPVAITSRSAGQGAVDQKIVDAIHKRLEAGKVETPNDRRQRARSPLNGIQRIAPCKQGTTPADMKFQNVRCKDISSGGIGFYFPQPPDFETVIVALGSEPNCTYLHARVMHCRPIPPEHGPGFLIGCQFIGRALI